MLSIRCCQIAIFFLAKQRSSKQKFPRQIPSNPRHAASQTNEGKLAVKKKEGGEWSYGMDSRGK